jgi:hypothetical protein
MDRNTKCMTSTEVIEIIVLDLRYNTGLSMTATRAKKKNCYGRLARHTNKDLPC